MEGSSTPLAEYFWIAGIEAVIYDEHLPPVTHSTETTTIVEDGEPEDEEDAASNHTKPSAARHSRQNSANRFSKLSLDGRNSVQTIEEDDGNTRSNRSSATIKAKPGIGNGSGIPNGDGLNNGGSMGEFLGLMGDFDFDKALLKFAAERENFLEDLSFSAGAKTQARAPMVNPRAERIRADEAEPSGRVSPLRSIKGSIRRKISFRDMNSLRKQPSVARPMSQRAPSIRTTRRLSNYNSVIPPPEPLNTDPDMHPLKRRFEPMLLDRYPPKTATDEVARRGKFPDYVPMFAFPNDVQIVSSDDRPRSTWHGFTMTSDDNSKLYGITLIVWTALPADVAEVVENKCEDWRQSHMSNEERELAASLGVRLASERSHLSQLLAKLGTIPSGTPARDRLEDEIGGVEEKITLMTDMLRPLRHGAASRIEGLTTGETGLWAPRAYGILGRDPANMAFWKEWLKAIVVPMTDGAVLRIPPSSPKVGRWQPLEQYVVNLCTEAFSPLGSKTQVEIGVRELRLFSRKEAANEIPGSRTIDIYALFRCLSLENIVALFEYAMSESRIIFLSSHTSMLHLACHALANLLYPLKWASIFIPILPARLISALDAPCPYIVGVERRYERIDLPDDDYVLVDLDKDTIDATSQPNRLPRQHRRKLMSLLQVAAPHKLRYGVTTGPPPYAMEAFPYDSFSSENASLFTSVAPPSTLGKWVSQNSSSFADPDPPTELLPPVFNGFSVSMVDTGKSDRPGTSKSNHTSPQSSVSPVSMKFPPMPSTPVSRSDSGFALTATLREKFDVTQVALPDDETRQLFESNDISSVCTGSDSLFLGSNDGYVSILGKGWKVIRRFQAHEARITHMRQVEGTSLLVTIAEDMSSEPTLKAWALDKLIKRTNMPTCLSTLTVNNGRRQFPISAFAALDDLTQIAVGFANGAVTVIRGDLVHDLGTKQRIVYESEEPVTGVQLTTQESSTTLFISTVSRILQLALSRRGQGSPPKTIEDSGCAAGCMTVDPKTGDIVVARDDAIYTYRLDGRGPPRAYESPKRLVSMHNDYIAVAGPSSVSSSRDPEALRRRFGSATADGLFNAWTFVLLEPDLRVVAHTETLISPVRFILEVWGDLFTITEEGKTYRYHEKPLQQRLEMLYQRNMFPLAIELAQNSGMNNEQQSLIYRRFGDHLYQKSDYDGAMNQYIRAIDATEPSQVIRKFLDTQRIHNLILYLEKLHHAEKATSDHTTLLLNCYAKLKDIKKLEEFIMAPGDLKFDLDTAITMCRQGGYYQQAAYLAKKHGETELVVDILIEDSKSYDEALDYIWHQDPAIAYPCIQKYARVLIEHCPKDATKLFVDYYTSNYRPRRTVVLPIEVSGTASAPGGSSSGLAAGAASAVQNLTNLLILPSYISPTTGTPGSTRPNETVVQVDEDDLPRPKYDPPPPRTAFSSFIDHPDEFITFLEACLEEEKLRDLHSTDLYTTLFEMYLHKSNEKKGSLHKEEWEAKAKKLIEGDHVPMESSNVLLLSHLSNFQDGTVLVKEQAGLLSDIFRSYTSAKDTRGALKALRKYGPEEPQLYPAALAYLTSDPRVLEEAGPDELAAILTKIDKDGLMAPLQVVQTLVGQNSGGGVATMGMIKPYLRDTITRERKEIAQNRNRISTLRADTEKRRSDLEDLSSKPAVFQATRCSDCGQGLDLPAVHFMCKHSFHQRCLRGGGEDDEIECPKCAGENEVIRKMREGQRERAGRHEIFKADLENSSDRFATISEWFSRGVMDAQGSTQAS